MNIALVLKIGFRNIFRQMKRTFSLGINFAIVSLLLVLIFSFSRGASQNVSLNLAKATSGYLNVAGEYIVQGKSYIGVMEYPKVQRIIRETFGEGADSYPRYSVYTATYNKGISKRIRYYGIVPELEKTLAGQFTFVKGSWEAFAGDPDSIIVSKELADYFELQDVAELTVSIRTRFGAFNTAVFKIAGVYTSSNFFVENLAISHFGRLQALDLASPDTASVIAVFFPDLKNLDKKRDALVEALNLGGYEAKKPKNASDAINAVTAASPRSKAEKVGSPLVVRLTVTTLSEVLGILGNIISVINYVGVFLAAILLLVTAVAIFINLRMSINDRMREIGTMRTIGIGGRGITLLFVFEGLILSVLFVALGFVAAFVVIVLFKYGVAIPPKGAFSLLLERGHIVFLPHATDLLFVLLAIGFFAALFSFIPARQAGRIRPVEALTRLE